MSQFTIGQPVTVTLIDGNGEPHLFDGFVQRTDFWVHTDTSRAWSPHSPTSRDTDGARPFLIVESASGQDYGHSLDKLRSGPDHAFVGDTMWVAVNGTIDGPGATIAPADDTALGRIDTDLSPERVIAKATAALAETHPVLAQRLTGAVEDIETAAYTRGCDTAAD